MDYYSSSSSLHCALSLMGISWFFFFFGVFSFNGQSSIDLGVWLQDILILTRHHPSLAMGLLRGCTRRRRRRRRVGTDIRGTSMMGTSQLRRRLLRRTCTAIPTSTPKTHAPRSLRDGNRLSQSRILKFRCFSTFLIDQLPLF